MLPRACGPAVCRRDTRSQGRRLVSRSDEHEVAAARLHPTTGSVEVLAVFFLDPSEYLHYVVELLAKQPPMRFWTAPPLGCWIYLCPCTPCAQPAHASYQLLKFARHALFLYFVAMPFVPFLRMMVHAEVTRPHQPSIFMLLFVAESALALIALYALFIMYWLTHDILKGYRTSLKFFTLKAVILLAPVQQLALEAVVGDHSEWWECVLNVVLSVPLCMLLRHAYPPHELPMKRGLGNATVTLPKPRLPLPTQQYLDERKVASRRG
mmetsp:Transcript_24318/g.50924  ORF Transcript_24318/g.50924 Transcript_24318/m.50924 type:complete len:266 (+) Transcript_24318:477-1274(+)